MGKRRRDMKATMMIVALAFFASAALGSEYEHEDGVVPEDHNRLQPPLSIPSQHLVEAARSVASAIGHPSATESAALQTKAWASIAPMPCDECVFTSNMAITGDSAERGRFCFEGTIRANFTPTPALIAQFEKDEGAKLGTTCAAIGYPTGPDQAWFDAAAANICAESPVSAHCRTIGEGSKEPFDPAVSGVANGFTISNVNAIYTP